MPVVISDEPWVPAQEKFESGADYRSFDAGRMSRKRAREVEENGIEDDEMVDEHEMERLRKASRPTYKQVVGKASGRAWKQPAKQRAASFMKAQTGGVKVVGRPDEGEGGQEGVPGEDEGGPGGGAGGPEGGAPAAGGEESNRRRRTASSTR